MEHVDNINTNYYGDKETEKKIRKTMLDTMLQIMYNKKLIDLNVYLKAKADVDRF